MEQIPFPKGIGEKELRDMLQSKAGKQLIELLNKKDGAVLRQAAAAAKNGQYEKAFEALAPLMESTDASKLARELSKYHG
jgi:phage gp29-like protein